MRALSTEGREMKYYLEKICALRLLNMMRSVLMWPSLHSWRKTFLAVSTEYSTFVKNSWSSALR
eukprot:2952081-Ditylum_brightwellii.AAC.1